MTGDKGIYEVLLYLHDRKEMHPQGLREAHPQDIREVHAQWRYFQGVLQAEATK